jgi:hypothetical protein
MSAVMRISTLNWTSELAFRFTMRILCTVTALVWFLASAMAEDLSGTYGVDGQNPNGSRYDGKATITMSANGCRVDWIHGANTSFGKCKLEGKTFTVNFDLGGGKGVVVYELRPNGDLVGEWWMNNSPNSKGKETLYLRKAASPSV